MVERALTDCPTTNTGKISLYNALATYYINRYAVATGCPILLDTHMLPEDDAEADVEDDVRTRMARLDTVFLSKATWCLNQADKIDPRHRMSWMNKGYLHLFKNDLPKALMQFDTLLSSFPTHVPALLGKAQALLKKLQWAEALRTFQLVLTVTSQNTRHLRFPTHMHANIRVAIGLCFEKLGLTEEADYAFRRGIALDPDNVPAFLGLASLHLDRRRRKEAVDKEETGPGESVQLLKRAHEILKVRRAQYQKCIQAEIVRKQQAEKGATTEEDDEMLVDEFPPDFPPMMMISNPVLTLKLAEQFMDRGDMDTSLSLVDQTLKATNPAGDDMKELLGDAHYLLGFILHHKSKFDGAAAAYARAAEYRPALLKADFGMAQIHMLKQDGKAAIDLLEKIRRKFRELYMQNQQKKSNRHFYHTSVNDYEDYDTLKVLAHACADLSTFGLPEVAGAQATKLYQQAAAVKRDFKSKLDSALKTVMKVNNPHATGQTGADDIDILLLQARFLGTTKRAEALQPLLKAAEMAAASTDKVTSGDSDLPAEKSLAVFNRVQIFNNLAVVFHLEGSFDAAARWYEKAAEQLDGISAEEGRANASIADMQITIRYNRARLLEDTGQQEASEIEYNKIVNDHPAHSDSLIRLALIQSDRGNVIDAQRRLTEIVHVHKTDLDARTHLGTLQSALGHTKAARKTFEEILQNIDKYDLVSLLKLGNIYLDIARERPEESHRNAHYGRAFEFFDKVLRLDPMNTYAANGIARALAERGALEDARSFFTQIRESAASNPLLVVNLAHVTLEIGQMENAIALYEFALKKMLSMPEHHGEILSTYLCTARAHYILGKTSKDISKMRKSIDYVSKALQLRPGEEGLWFDLALCQQQFAQVVLDLKDDDPNRTSAVVNQALEYLSNARDTFLWLVSLPRKPTPDVGSSYTSVTSPYDRRIAQEREKHGEVIKNKLLRRKQEQDEKEQRQREEQEELRAKRDAFEAEKRRREQEELELRKQRDRELQKQREQLQAQIQADFAAEDREMSNSQQSVSYSSSSTSLQTDVSALTHMHITAEARPWR